MCPVCTVASPEAAAPVETTPGMVAGRYLLQRQLGRGASKDVWLAHDLTLDRGVALARVSGPGAWERLRREARLTARLGGHRHIVTVHDVFEDDGTPCLVARYMTGGSLADRLERTPGGRLEPQEVIAAGREIANALAHAHAHGVVHRDVKPDNVWIDAEGEAALGDFGVAVAEGESAPPAGTPRYAAPEQTLGEAATPLSDLFALGVTLYELLCGVRPFDSKDVFRMRAPAPPSSRVTGVPEALDRLILALVEPDPADRPADAAGVARELDRLITRPNEDVIAPAGVVGRRPELERLRKALTQAWSGTVRTVVIAGESGIGKTTLLDALANDASTRGGVAVRGRGEAEGRPYGVWRPVVRALTGLVAGDPDPALGPLLGAVAGTGGEEQRLRLYDAVADLLAIAAADSPLVVVLDDLHWADASSLRLLAHVVAAETTARVLVAGAYTAGEAAFGDVLEEIEGDSRVERIELAGLDPEAVRALLPAEVAQPAADAIHRRTRGNPFYVAELVRLLSAEDRADDDTTSATLVPARVRDVVRRRVERLGDEVCRVLEVGAVAGRFTIADLSRAAGVSRAAAAAAVDRGLASGLVSGEQPGHFAFAHGIVRDAVRDALPEQRRGAIHEAVAAALIVRRDAGADVPAAQIAHHALAAARAGADPQSAWEAALEAAREAAASLGHAEAASHYAEALEAIALGAEASAAERRATLLALAEATFAAGDIEGARRRYSQAAASARRDGDAHAMAEAALGFSQVHPYGAVDPEGIALLTQALERLPAEDGSLRARSLGLLAIFEPDQERREALIDDALAMAQRLGDEAIVGALYPNQLVVEWRPERAAHRARAAEEVVRVAAQHADHGALAWAYLHRIRDALQAGDIARADADLDRARPVAHATRRSHYRWFLMVSEAGRAAFAGRLEEAERLNDEALALNRQHGDDCYQEYTVHRLVLARLRWRPQDADAAALRGFAARYPQLPVWEAMLASLEWELGDVEAARRSVVLCAHDGFAAVVGSPDFLPAALCLAEAASGAAEPAHVEQLYELLLPHAAANPVLEQPVGDLGPGGAGLGLLAAADDRPQRRRRALRRRAAAGGGVGRAGLGAAHDRRLAGDRRPGAGSRSSSSTAACVLARELGLPGVAARIADEAQPRSDHHAVALDHRLRRVVEAHARVAAVAPVGAPAGAQQEVVGAVAEQRGGVAAVAPTCASNVVERRPVAVGTCRPARPGRAPGRSGAATCATRGSARCGRARCRRRGCSRP